MSQTDVTNRATNADMAGLSEKLLQVAHRQADVMLQQAQGQPRYEAWHLVVVAMAAGAAAAAALVTLGHWL